MSVTHLVAFRRCASVSVIIYLFHPFLFNPGYSSCVKSLLEFSLSFVTFTDMPTVSPLVLVAPIAPCHHAFPIWFIIFLWVLTTPSSSLVYLVKLQIWHLSILTSKIKQQWRFCLKYGAKHSVFYWRIFSKHIFYVLKFLWNKV